MDKRKKPELLSPAGSIESLYAAVNSGCDAVYFGGKAFSARSYASNFSIEEIKEVTNYCRVRGIKTYLTLNTLIKEREMLEVYDYLKGINETLLDAIILQDIGVMKLIKDCFPHMEIHASTQMTAHSKEDVAYLKELGFTRAVLSRELSLKDIVEIKDAVKDIEIETFIHGALCYAYSGQCLMSSFIGGRSGNRGKCAQPCRLPYNFQQQDKRNGDKDQYLLSLKDMQTLDIIPLIAESGIDSLKIEGRMKRPEYVAGVTSLYRKYLDLYLEEGKENYKVNEGDIEKLKQLFNRGGFSKGYYLGKTDMVYPTNPKNTGIKVGEIHQVNKKGVSINVTKDLNPGDVIEALVDHSPNPSVSISRTIKKGEKLTIQMKGPIKKGQEIYRIHHKQLLYELKHHYTTHDRKRNVTAKVEAIINNPLRLTLICDDIKVTVEGDRVEESHNRPTDRNRIIQQISKLGNSPFQMTQVDAKVDSNIFVPVSVINQLRRDGVEQLIGNLLAVKKEGIYPYATQGEKKSLQEKRLTVLITNMNQWERVIHHHINRLYVEWEVWSSLDFNTLASMIMTTKDKNIEVYMVLPHIQKSKEYNKLNALDQLEFDGYLIRTLGQYNWCKRDSKKDRALDYTLNTYNNNALSHWLNSGANSVTVSVELNQREVGGFKENNRLEYYAYGYLPVMITEQCVIKDCHSCGQQCNIEGQRQLYYLKDRKNNLFPVKSLCPMCYTKIYNISPLYLLNNWKEFFKLPVAMFRLSFLNETNDEIDSLICGYQHVLNGHSLDTIDEKYKKVLDNLQDKGYTKGHFARGVE